MKFRWAILVGVGVSVSMTVGVLAASKATGGRPLSSKLSPHAARLSPRGVTVGTYVFRGVGGKCLSVSGGGEEAARVVLSTCTAAATQGFQVIKLGDVYELRAFGKCLDVSGDELKSEAPLQLLACAGTPAQRFDLRGDLLRPKEAMGLAVEARGGSTADGTPVQLSPRNLGAAQSWKAVPVAIAPNGSVTVPVTSASVPTCSDEQVREWDSATSEREGALVSDPKRESIGFAPAKREGGFYPLTGQKETMCGHFARLGVNDDEGVFDAMGDNDWNIHLVPAHPTFIDLKNRFGGTHRKEVEAEIFTDKRYWKSSPWFHNDWVKSPLAPPYAAGQGHLVCTYGPFVDDKSHEGESWDGCDATKEPCGKKLEIHPAELLWWRDVLPTYEEALRRETRRVSTEYMTFLHLQDDSGDFDDRSDFEIEGATPDGWEPWSGSPLRGLVRIPWRWEPGGAKTELRVIDDFVSGPATGAGATRGEQTLAIDGEIVLRVSTTTDVDPSLGVALDEGAAICRRPGTGEILGFVSIRDDIGGSDEQDAHDTEATHVFSVAKSTVTSARAERPLEAARTP